MKLYTYVVARDFGFAPNPFFGWCTLATCKPGIRATAPPGDWIIGTGAKGKHNMSGRLIFAMLVEEALAFEEYWADPRFVVKRPLLNGSLKQLYGDNIYHRASKRARWVQEDSHHSLEGGAANARNVSVDTRVNRVLVSRKFVYYGRNAPPIPRSLRHVSSTGEDVCCPGRGHRVRANETAVALAAWLNRRAEWGLRGVPSEFESHKRNGSISAS